MMEYSSPIGRVLWRRCALCNHFWTIHENERPHGQSTARSVTDVVDDVINALANGRDGFFSSKGRPETV